MAEQQSSLGEFLRSERERRGISIEQLASATKISVKVLHALEADHYVDLPAKPFIRGFVSSYARFIGLDPKEVLIRFSDFVEDRAKERPLRDAGHSGYAFERRETEQSRTILWFVMGGFILFAGIAFLVFKPKLHHHHGTHVDKLREAYPSPSPVISPSPELSPAASPGPSGSPVPVVVPAAVPAPSKAPSPVAPTPSPSLAPQPAEPAEADEEEKETSVSPSPSPSVNPKDPLNSGRNLKVSAVKQKLIIKASASVPVRYQLDDRPPMRLMLGQDKMLVLKAQQHIYFGILRSDEVQISYNGGPYQSINEGPGVTKTPHGMILVLPSQLADSIKDPFKDLPQH